MPLSRSYLNLLDTFGEDKAGRAVLEVLTQQNEILDDAVAMECNNGTQHDHSIRSGLPSPTWGRLYKGVQPSKGQKVMVSDTTGFLESAYSIDERELEVGGERAQAARMSEAYAHLEAMNQEMAAGLFYHSTKTTPEKFDGFVPRFNVLNGADTGNQVVDAGGSGSDNTSIWFVTWGDHACHLLYPQGTTAGVKRIPMGRQKVVTDAGTGAFYMAEEEMFRWHIGLAVKDWRYVSRVANIDVSELRAGNVDIHGFLITAYHKLQSTRSDGKNSRIAMYCNREVKTALHKMSAGIGGTGVNAALYLQPKELEGKVVTTFQDIPIRNCDAILNTEARVV